MYQAKATEKAESSLLGGRARTMGMAKSLEIQSPSTRPHLQTLPPIRDQVVKHMSLRAIFTQTTTPGEAD